jgi:hypothetical protein
MYIGLSLSRCVRDIVEEKVDMYEVLCIIARTNFNWEDSNDQNALWTTYTEPNMFSEDTWADLDKDDVFRTVDALWGDGKIHQPRKFGAHPGHTKYVWLSCIVPPNLANPSVQQAWEDYRLLADLTKENFFRDDF